MYVELENLYFEEVIYFLGLNVILNYRYLFVFVYI